MKKAGIEKASARLEKARRCLLAAGEAKSHNAFMALWADFLIALNAVPVILDASAKGNPTSQQWCGRVGLARPKDPLVQYLRQARNVEEHGLEATAVEDPGGIGFGVRQNLSGGELIIHNGMIFSNLKSDTGEPVKIAIVAPHTALVPLIDQRYGTVFPVPTVHLGSAVSDVSPIHIGGLGLAYYAALLDEARVLPA